MALDKDALLKEFAGDEASGPFLEIDERLSRGKAVIAGAQKFAEFKRFPGRFPDAGMQPPEMARPEIDSAIKGLLEFLAASRDLRAISILAQGLALRGRLDDVCAILEVAVELIATQWDSLNPRFPESVYDTVAERVDPLRPLNDGDRLWWAVRETKLVEHTRLGVFTLGDLVPRARPDENTPPFADGFEAALVELSRDDFKAVRGHIQGIWNALGRLEKDLGSVLNAMGGEAQEVPAPEFDEVRLELKSLINAMDIRIGPDPDEEEVEAVGDVVAGEAPKKAGVSTPGTIATRDDVLRTLQSLMDYYAKAEPGSPVPLLLMRARSLVGKDFFEILADLTPESLDGMNKLAGRVP